jgi:hypothetical protein
LGNECTFTAAQHTQINECPFQFLIAGCEPNLLNLPKINSVPPLPSHLYCNFHPSEFIFIHLTVISSSQFTNFCEFFGWHKIGIYFLIYGQFCRIILNFGPFSAKLLNFNLNKLILLIDPTSFKKMRSFNVDTVSIIGRSERFKFTE